MAAENSPFCGTSRRVYRGTLAALIHLLNETRAAREFSRRLPLLTRAALFVVEYTCLEIRDPNAYEAPGRGVTPNQSVEDFAADLFLCRLAL